MLAFAAVAIIRDGRSAGFPGLLPLSPHRGPVHAAMTTHRKLGLSLLPSSSCIGSDAIHMFDEKPPTGVFVGLLAIAAG